MLIKCGYHQNVMRSLFSPEPALDPITQKKIAITLFVGIPLVIGLTALIYLAFLTNYCPWWVGGCALVAEPWIASSVLARVQRLRKPGECRVSCVGSAPTH